MYEAGYTPPGSFTRAPLTVAGYFSSYVAPRAQLPAPVRCYQRAWELRLHCCFQVLGSNLVACELVQN